jgi:hypothetical protein
VDFLELNNVTSLAYPNLLVTKGYVVVVQQCDISVAKPEGDCNKQWHPSQNALKQQTQTNVTN